MWGWSEDAIVVECILTLKNDLLNLEKKKREKKFRVGGEKEEKGFVGKV